MQRRSTPSRGTLGAALILSLATAACGDRDPMAPRRRAEAAVVRRQIGGLRQLTAAVEQGSLSTGTQVAIGVDEAIVRQIVNASLPVEKDVGGRFHVRLGSADVLFRDSQSGVILKGQASLKDHSDVFVNLILAGGLDELRVDERAGSLKAHILLYHFEVEKLGAGGDRPVLRGLVESLARETLSTLQQAVPEVEIPVRLDPAIRVKGISMGPISVAPGELALHFAIARVVPLRERLWVLLDATVGEWRDAPELGAEGGGA